MRAIKEECIIYRRNTNKGRIDLMDLSNDMIYQLGVEAGRKQVMDHIQRQCSKNKPIEANGELYWLTDSRQHLRDIMDDIDNAWNEEHMEKKYIVPISITYNTYTEVKELLVKADDPKTAMLIALGFENNHIGWIVDEDYENYKQIKI